ncbi:hypothetical protein [Arcobacter sp. YIC-310]|uniref:hypothetical protein n=1 Tax=Arcobacter sp. YIC-310 TaxID=3376632 RepID=UPI003C25920B
MKYEELIHELCDVIKQTENNATLIYENLQNISDLTDNLSVIEHDKNRINSQVSDAMGHLQHQDLYRQRIEKVVNFVCEKHDIDKSQYNIANSAKNIDSDDNLSEEELEALIKQMQA